MRILDHRIKMYSLRTNSNFENSRPKVLRSTPLFSWNNFTLICFLIQSLLNYSLFFFKNTLLDSCKIYLPYISY